jgi:toxin HigB-1
LNISFTDKKFEQQCNEQRQLVKKQGALRAKKITQRLGLLRAAHNLADLGPFGRCHELKGDRSGQLALDLDHPYRLIFIPDHDPMPCKADGGLDWQRVTAITILGVEDYHG